MSIESVASTRRIQMDVNTVNKTDSKTNSLSEDAKDQKSVSDQTCVDSSVNKVSIEQLADRPPAPNSKAKFSVLSRPNFRLNNFDSLIDRFKIVKIEPVPLYLESLLPIKKPSYYFIDEEGRKCIVFRVFDTDQNGNVKKDSEAYVELICKGKNGGVWNVGGTKSRLPYSWFPGLTSVDANKYLSDKWADENTLQIIEDLLSGKVCKGKDNNKYFKLDTIIDEKSDSSEMSLSNINIQVVEHPKQIKIEPNSEQFFSDINALIMEYKLPLVTRESLRLGDGEPLLLRNAISLPLRDFLKHSVYFQDDYERTVIVLKMIDTDENGNQKGQPYFEAMRLMKYGIWEHHVYSHPIARIPNEGDSKGIRNQKISKLMPQAIPLLNDLFQGKIIKMKGIYFKLYS